MQYVATLQQSFTPSLMRSTLERRQFLVEACRTHAASARQLRTEVQALQNADVPIFRTKRRCLRLNLTDAEVARSVAIVSAKLAKGRMANYQD
jgi:lantibiotic modifying enzyme